ncbi:hypothetical protein PU683_02530 [Kosakonia cowanii]|uniref:HofO family protein n=1 Tax=Kosakonia cowanii TaxID=208223 RepID=UPI0023F741BC|nr:hypothetical protein [Kosakonia cowanii]MDF7758411.1 hypothetical protein [Kosakonia cowanii]
MALNPDVWLALSPRMRAVCWLAATLIGILLIGWFAIRPLNHAQRLTLRQQSALQLELQAEWRKLRALALPEEQIELSEVRRFSPLDFHGQTRQLLRWQPMQSGGEMVLESRWPQAVETFLLLAERDMQIPAFSLSASDNGLRFTLQLEHDDDR